MMNQTKRQQGFTLIELLVVIGIIAVLVALTANAWRGWARRQELLGAARTVRAALDEARSDARRESISQMVTWDADSITTTNNNGSSFQDFMPAGVTITTPTDTIIYTAPFGRAQIPGGDDFRIAVTSSRFEGRNTREIVIFGVTGKTVVLE
jgi:prepilin-type N-terminal cleavage/methylation domain-containing protein